MKPIPSTGNGKNRYRATRADSFLFGGNAPYVEELYESYLNHPGSVAPHWRNYFDALALQPGAHGGSERDVAHWPVVQAFAERAHTPRRVVARLDPDQGRKRTAAQQLIATHRNIGQRWADIDPLRRSERPAIPELEPDYYGFADADWEEVFDTGNTYFGAPTMTLRDLLNALRQTYCGVIGAEFMYITEQTQKRWWQERLEASRAQPQLTREEKLRVLQRLSDAETLERYLHTRFTGQKRFSLEGGESFIVAMDELVRHAGRAGVQEMVIGMAHRGRLNVLINVLGKLPSDLFAEFEHTAPENLPQGDVKYHQGFASDVLTPGGTMHLSLAFNPSHLEIVNPVVEGSVRSRQQRRGDTQGNLVMPVLVHGDAAFAGQGVVMETLAMAQTRGYYTGGTVHLVINNQIGFTTSDPRDSRSSLYCTDIVKMIEAPVLHVNGDDPESVVQAVRWACDYRMRFKKDVVVDIVCFRRLGHNEQDTPALTQPLMYKKISAHPGTRQVYAERLVAQGEAKDIGERFVAQAREALEQGRPMVDLASTASKHQHAADWSSFMGKDWSNDSPTIVSRAEWQRLGLEISRVPEGFELHPLARKVLEARAAMAMGTAEVDWGMGEHMAFATLLAAGYGVRVSGEDCGRGTFTHRHAVLHDQRRERWDSGTYIPLQHVSENQASFEIIDSILSEEAVLGFEYGFASSKPDVLTIWEAQFGDFANGAQVVIDQFIAAGEAKWGRLNGLTLLLPHGYEGQGPEHSSARLERYLQLCASHNICVAQPTTASQIFHVLRRQMLRGLRKPLVLMTPKSLLRHKNAASSLEAFTQAGFAPILGDAFGRDAVTANKVRRVIACSGKVFFDLLKARNEQGREDCALVRVEQLYPFPVEEFKAEMSRYPQLQEVLWCQDEPFNQGAWFFLQRRILQRMKPGQKLGFSGRDSSPSPAAGYADLHEKQQRELIANAFGVLKGFILTA